jgi:ABC-type phosphate transport system substrate-binding protein
MATIGQKTEARWRLLGAALVVLLSCVLVLQRQAAWGQEVKPAFQIVVNTEVGFGSVERDVLADIFLKQRTTWPDGSMAHPVDQLPNAQVRAHFSNHVIHRSVQAVRSYWQQRIFSGRGVPPPELDSDEAVLSFVRARGGAVGYVSLSAEPKGVRVITLR